MKKLSTKVAAVFLTVALIIEAGTLLYLHRILVITRVDEEFAQLLANGANHRDVLMEHYSSTTMRQLVLMGKSEEREVIITDLNGNILRSSDDIKLAESQLPLVQGLSGSKDQVVLSDWRESPFIASAHPYYVDEVQSGYVVMFQHTGSLNSMIDTMNMHFTITGITSILALILTFLVIVKIRSKQKEINKTINDSSE